MQPELADLWRQGKEFLVQFVRMAVYKIKETKNGWDIVDGSVVGGCRNGFLDK